METLNNLDIIDPIAVGAMIGIRCFPKTKLAQIAKKQGVLKEDTNLLEPYYYVSPEIDKQWMIDTIEEYADTHENFFIPTSKKGLHTDGMIAELYRDGFRGPFWEVNKELKRREEEKLACL